MHLKEVYPLRPMKLTTIGEKSRSVLVNATQPKLQLSSTLELLTLLRKNFHSYHIPVLVRLDICWSGYIVFYLFVEMLKYEPMHSTNEPTIYLFHPLVCQFIN
jgi:hypothetical protein